MEAEKEDFPKTRSLFLILIALISLLPIADALTMVNSCQNLVVPGETYALSQNISISDDSCFTVDVDDETPIAAEYVTLDCNGFSIIGNNASGTRGVSTSAPNTIIRNCDIRGFETGVVLNGGYGSLLNSSVEARDQSSSEVSLAAVMIGNLNLSTFSHNNRISNVNIDYDSLNAVAPYFQNGIVVFGDNNIIENAQINMDVQNTVNNFVVSSICGYTSNFNQFSNISGTLSAISTTAPVIAGLYLYNLQGGHNSISDMNLSHGVVLHGESHDNLSGKFISTGNMSFSTGNGYALSINYGGNNLIKNAAFICEGTCAGHVGYFSSNSNTFCLNNFTDMPGAYVTNIGATGRGGKSLESVILGRNPFMREKIREASESGRKAAESAPKDRTETSQFSCMDNGLEQGNIWGNVASGDVIIHGVIPSSVPGFYIGSTPYSAVNSQGKLNGEISDPYPLTPLSAALECGALGEEGETYAMTNNQSSSGTCYTITAADVTLDCNGFSITGNNAPGTYGVYSNQPGTIVKNCIISNFSEGIRYSGSAGSLISNSTISATYASGSAIRITAGSHDSQLINNTITAFDAHGIYVDGGTDVAIDCQDARLLCFNTLENTDVAPYPCNTTHSAYIDCIRYKRLPVRYPGTYGIYTNQPGTSASNCNIDNFAVGIMANGATGASFKYNHVRSAGTRNGGAVVLANGSGNTIGDSILSADTNTGLRMENEHHGEISGNEISGASAALELGGASVGSLISGNTFSCPGNSLVKISAASNGNTFAWNNFTNSGTGFFVEDGGSNAYSAAIDGQNQGNLWGNVLNGSVRIAGAEASTLTDALYIGSAGPGYPYSAATAQGRLYGNVVDEAPLTPSIITNLAIEGGISFEDCPVGHCTVVSASASNTPWREVSASIAASEGACTQILNSMDGNRLDVSYRCSHSTSATPLFNITFDNGIDTVSTAGTHQYPVCFEFAEPNETYFLGSNANAGTSSCFVISAPNVTLDCKGYSIIGSNEPLSKGIATSQFNTTIKNCAISGFSEGISLNGATNCTITNVSAHATGQGAYAIHLGNSQNNSLSNFSASSSDDIAVRLQNAIYNALSDFTAASDTGYALYLYQSANNTLSNFSAIALDETAIRIFNSASNNLTNFAATTRTDRFERHAIEVNSNSPYNRLSNFTAISNESGVIGIYQSASNIISFGRLISSNTQEYPLVELGGNSNRNAFYLNNFTENSGMYVEDNAGSYGVYNYFNYTHEGKNQGNIWGNVADGAVQVKGYVNSSIRGFQIGTSGAGRPYNAVTSQGKVGGSAPVVDYAPLTNRHALTLTTYPYLNAGGYAYGANASVPYGTYVNISAANRAGYKFRVWDVISYQGERCIITNRMAANTTVLMLGGDCRLQVGFGNATRTNLTIQVSPSGAGSISVARDIYGSAISVNYSGPEYGGNPTVIASSFEYGENPKINATSNAGFVFSNWTRVSGDCSVFHVPCSNINPVGGCNTNPKSIVGMHFTDCVLRANFNSTGSG